MPPAFGGVAFIRQIRLFSAFKRLHSILLNAIFPGICCGCGSLYTLPKDRYPIQEEALPDEIFGPLTERYLCKTCRQQFSGIASPMCDQCGKPFVSPHGVDHLCPQCMVQPFVFTTARAAGCYEGGLRAAIHQYKYRCVDQLAKPLGTLLWRTLLLYWHPSRIDCIVPVPLHPRRLRWRGFNQAHLLTIQWPALAQRFGMSVPRGWICPDLIQRFKYTQPQIGLKKEERNANLRNAFILRGSRSVEGERVLLVDDVLTTGATAQACARILLKAGAAEVNVLTLARTVI